MRWASPLMVAVVRTVAAVCLPSSSTCHAAPVPWLRVVVGGRATVAGAARKEGRTDGKGEQKKIGASSLPRPSGERRRKEDQGRSTSVASYYGGRGRDRWGRSGGEEIGRLPLA